MNVTEVKLSCGYRRYSTQVTWTSAFGKKIRVGWATPFDVVEVLDHLVLKPGRAEEPPSGFVSTPADSPRWLGPAHVS